jgi:hypothetical protein
MRWLPQLFTGSIARGMVATFLFCWFEIVKMDGQSLEIDPVPRVLTLEGNLICAGTTLLAQNVFCLYRHHDRAMSNTTNLFERELVAHLFEKHRALIERYSPKRRVLGVNRSRFEQTAETSAHGRKRAGGYLAQVT